MVRSIKIISISILLIGLSVIGLTEISLRAEGDDVDGTIDVAGSNNKVGVNAFELQSTSGTALVTDSAVIDPYNHYRMHLDFQDVDGINDVTSITFKLFNLDRPVSQMRDSFDSYTTTGIREIDGENYPDFIRSDDAFIVTWDSATDTFAMEGGSGSTWQLSEGAITSNPNNHFAFDIDFRVSKIALNNNAWYIGALIVDGANNELTEETFVTNGNYGVNWFGELQVSQDAVIRWNDVDAGTDFYGVGTTTTMINVSTQALESVTFLSNGYYQQRMGSSATWAAIGDIPLNELYGNEAKLTTDAAQSTFNPQEFGLGVALSYDDTSVNARLDSRMITIRGHQLDTTTYNKQIWRDRTRDAGDEFSNIIFRVALADIFQNATYEGKLTVGISNETDILSATAALEAAETGLVTSGSVVGVYATTESEFISLLSNSSIQVPIYLQNGFIELRTAPSITVANTALKPVIGDVFITGDDIQITNMTMLYGDLHIEGDHVLLTNTNIMSHSPGGDLYIKALNFTGANINIEGSVFVSNSASGIISQDQENSPLSDYRIAGNVHVSENSVLTIKNMAFPNLSAGGTINVTGNSFITLEDFTSFDTLNINNSSGQLTGDDFTSSGGWSSPDTRPVGSSMTLTNATVTQSAASFTTVNLYQQSTWNKQSGWAQLVTLRDQSQLDFDGGEITELNLNHQSQLMMSDGYVYDDLRMFGSYADISGGEIGFNTLSGSQSGNTNTHGIFLDITGTHTTTPSSITISGVTNILHLLAKQSASITMDGTNSEIDRVTDIRDDATFNLHAGLVNYLRMRDNGVFDMDQSGAKLYKAHIFNDSFLTVSDGTLGIGDSGSSLISINDHARFEMTGGQLNVGSFTDAKDDDDFIDSSATGFDDVTVTTVSSNGKHGLHIRDDAVVTLGSITIASNSELELRDNGQLTMTHNADFNRMVKDYVSVFNEHSGENSNLSTSGGQSLVEIYVEADTDGASTRPTRSNADNPSSIAFDYDSIDGTGSAFEEARRLFDNFGHAVNVYVLDGTYNEESTLQMDRDDLGLIYSPNGRADRKTNVWGLTESPSSVAVVDKGIDITASSNVVQGVYFDLDNEAIHVSQSGLFSDVILRYNYIDQAGSNESVILVESKDFQVEGNYLTRPTDDANGSAALVLRGELQTSSIVDKNSINNISGHAVVFEQIGAASTANLSIDLNVIGLTTRPVLGHAFYFSSGVFDQITFVSNDIQNISNTAILFGDITINQGVSHQLDQIWNINTGHAIHYTSDVVFGPSYVDITLIDVELNTGQREANGIFFDQISEVKNIELIHTAGSTYYFENMQSALRIEGATTISGIEVDSPNVQNIRGDAFYLQGTNLENIQFTHNPNLTNGTRVTSSLTSDITQKGLIQNVSQNAIYLEGTTLDGFAMNGMVINQFATAGDAYAGIDFNVQHLSNLLINQALFRLDESTGGGGGTQFKEYRAIQTEFTNGLGPALRFHLNDNYTYSNNQIFNPDIDDNAVGIAFTGTLSSSNPITKIFGTNANFSVNPTLSDLKAFVTASGISLTSPTAMVIGENQSGLGTNGVEIQDDTLTLDETTFRSDFASLNHASNVDQVFFINDGASQSIYAASVPALFDVQVASAIDRVTLSNGTSAYIMASSYYVADDEETIVGEALDDLSTSNGNLSVELDVPSDVFGASSAKVYIETIGSGVTLQSSTINESYRATFNVSVASISGSSTYVSLPSNTRYTVVVVWVDNSDNRLSASGFTIDTTQTTSAFITTLKTSTNESIPTFKGLLDNTLVGTVDSNISETAFFTNLMSNLDANTEVDTYTEFLTLFSEVEAYEVALYDAVNLVNNTLTSAGAINPTVLDDVIASLDNTSIKESRDFTGTPALASTTLARLNAINVSLAAVASEASVIDQLLSSKPYADYFAILTALETILNTFDDAQINGINYDSLQSAVDDAASGEEVVLLKDVTETINLSSPVNIDFRGHTLTGDVTVEFTDDVTLTFTGAGVVTGDLTINAPNLTLNTNLQVQGNTIITAIGDSSLNTSGIHTGGISMNGPGRINALNETIQPVITINTTAAIQVDGFVSEVSISVNNAVLTINAAIQKLTHNNRPVQISSSNGAGSALPNLVQIQRTQLMYDTIAEAISQAAIGDTLIIGSGTFVEGDLVISKSLTLSGVNAGVSYDGSRNAETYISGGSITFSTTDITLDGLYILNSFVERFKSTENGLTIQNSVIHHEYVLDQYVTMSGSGHRYIVKGQSGVSDVTFENLKIIGPGKDAIATTSAISTLNAPSDFFIGGIDFNEVSNSTIRNVHIEEVSRYSLNISNTSSAILIEDFTVINSGHTSNDFMAALALFKSKASQGYPQNITLSGTVQFENVPIGIDLRAVSVSQFTAQNLTFTVSSVGVDILGLNVTETITSDELAQSLGATMRWQANEANNATNQAILDASGFKNLANYFLENPHGETLTRTYDFGGSDVPVIFIKSELE